MEDGLNAPARPNLESFGVGKTRGMARPINAPHEHMPGWPFLGAELGDVAAIARRRFKSANRAHLAFGPFGSSAADMAGSRG